LLVIAQGEDAILMSDGTNFDALVSSGSLWSRAGQIPGTITNDNAAAGNVGEFSIATSGSGALVTDTPFALISITLTAGDWDVEGTATFSGSGATPVNYLITSVGNVANQVHQGLGSHWQMFWGQTPFNFVGNVVLPINKWRLSIASGTQPVYVNVQAGFTPGAINAVGTIRARRAR
jgi:hypothetical protein